MIPENRAPDRTTVADHTTVAAPEVGTRQFQTAELHAVPTR